MSRTVRRLAERARVFAIFSGESIRINLNETGVCDIKTFMNQLLCSELFDNFLLAEASIAKDATFHIVSSPL